MFHLIYTILLLTAIIIKPNPSYRNPSNMGPILTWGHMGFIVVTHMLNPKYKTKSKKIFIKIIT